MTAEPTTRREVPAATVGRLPGYLQALTSLAERGLGTVSSGELAAAAGVQSAQLRRDLSYLGTYGVRGVGYDVSRLVSQIEQTLGTTATRPVVIVGLGHLGRALASYPGMSAGGFDVVGLVDVDPDVIGTEIAGRAVTALHDIEAMKPVPAVAVIATPAEAAQSVCDRLVAMGVRAILNFAPCVLSVPQGVRVRHVDLSTELQILGYHHTHQAAQAAGDEVGA